MSVSLPALNLDPSGNCITTQGVVLPPLAWNSEFEKRLRNQIQDVANAKIIHDVFREALTDVSCKPGIRTDIENWIVGHAIFFGLPSAQEKLKSSLRGLVFEEPLNTRLSWFLKETLRQISMRWKETRKERNVITILCSSHGGGNVSVANAMKSHLTAAWNSDVQIIDVQGPLFEESDALYQTTGIRETVLWNEVFVDLGLKEKFSEMNKIVEEARTFVPNNHIGLIKEMIVKLNSRLIISTISGFTRLIQLGELGIPLVVQHTDFCLNAKLYGENPYNTFSDGMLEQICVMDFLDREHFRIWLNANFPDKQRKHVQTNYPKVDPGLICSLGHPTDLALPEVMPGTKRPHVMIVMGNEGRFSSICELVTELLEHESELTAPVDLSVICGKSQRTYRHLLSLKESFSERVHMEVFQYVSREKMTELLTKSSSFQQHPGVVISKPGGSSVAECAAMKCYMLLIPVFAWETDNARYAVAHGIGELRNEHLALINQLNRILENASPITHEPLDWRSNLLTELQSIHH